MCVERQAFRSPLSQQLHHKPVLSCSAPRTQPHFPSAPFIPSHTYSCKGKMQRCPTPLLHPRTKLVITSQHHAPSHTVPPPIMLSHTTHTCSCKGRVQHCPPLLLLHHASAARSQHRAPSRTFNTFHTLRHFFNCSCTRESESLLTLSLHHRFLSRAHGHVSPSSPTPSTPAAARGKSSAVHLYRCIHSSAAHLFIPPLLPHTVHTCSCKGESAALSTSAAAATSLAVTMTGAERRAPGCCGCCCHSCCCSSSCCWRRRFRLRCSSGSARR